MDVRPDAHWIGLVRAHPPCYQETLSRDFKSNVWGVVASCNFLRPRGRPSKLSAFILPFPVKCVRPRAGCLFVNCNEYACEHERRQAHRRTVPDKASIVQRSHVDCADFTRAQHSTSLAQRLRPLLRRARSICLFVRHHTLAHCLETTPRLCTRLSSASQSRMQHCVRSNSA